MRQREVGQVEQLVRGVAAGGGLLEHPPGYGFASTARSGAAEDDRDTDLRHGEVPFFGDATIDVPPLVDSSTIPRKVDVSTNADE
ncbi:hypothetical protein GCM10011600_28350 [Pseudolysinimonas yzui]|uniref:Uncharacterized protein n=1 Tax=Pseudolysinimonas yzui TaxID=2708254 RepID=A0A8J3M3H5_9MICO|nr:hypothetical protein GCM10011600_28350 [Pseudolysinimonas yzui]